MQCSMDHIALNVENTETMITFYTRVLGLPHERLEAYRDGEVAFPSLRLGADTILDLFPPVMWRSDTLPDHGKGSLNHFCLAMGEEEWTSLCERLEHAGVTIEEGPDPRWGAHGTGTSVYFRDPEGNMIEARYYP